MLETREADAPFPTFVLLEPGFFELDLELDLFEAELEPDFFEEAPERLDPLSVSSLLLFEEELECLELLPEVSFLLFESPATSNFGVDIAADCLELEDVLVEEDGPAIFLRDVEELPDLVVVIVSYIVTL